jgi:branched-chain amino acid transport system ATP-binding protein
MDPDLILETNSLAKHFGALKAVSGVNLKIRQGKIHSIIGPNGAGKTTLFNLLTGFHVPTSGTVYFRGGEITGLPPEEICRKGIGRSFQITSTFAELPARENIRIALQSRTNMSYRFFGSMKGSFGLDEEAEQILERIGLGERGGVDTKNLSHGERRILDIGIGLATGPQLLLLDEPASGLVGDEITRAMELIKDISRTVTVVLVEHNIDVVLSVSDIIIVLYYGEIIATGSPGEIQKDERVQKVYLGRL